MVTTSWFIIAGTVLPKFFFLLSSCKDNCKFFFKEEIAVRKDIAL